MPLHRRDSHSATARMPAFTLPATGDPRRRRGAGQGIGSALTAGTVSSGVQDGLARRRCPSEIPPTASPGDGDPVCGFRRTPHQPPRSARDREVVAKAAGNEIVRAPPSGVRGKRTLRTATRQRETRILFPSSGGWRRKRAPASFLNRCERRVRAMGGQDFRMGHWEASRKFAEKENCRCKRTGLLGWGLPYWASLVS